MNLTKQERKDLDGWVWDIKRQAWTDGEILVSKHEMPWGDHYYVSDERTEPVPCETWTEVLATIERLRMEGEP